MAEIRKTAYQAGALLDRDCSMIPGIRHVIADTGSKKHTPVQSHRTITVGKTHVTVTMWQQF